MPRPRRPAGARGESGVKSSALDREIGEHPTDGRDDPDEPPGKYPGPRQRAGDEFCDDVDFDEESVVAEGRGDDVQAYRRTSPGVTPVVNCFSAQS